jgi:hypothetical protein
LPFPKFLHIAKYAGGIAAQAFRGRLRINAGNAKGKERMRKKKESKRSKSGKINENSVHESWTLA